MIPPDDTIVLVRIVTIGFTCTKLTYLPYSATSQKHQKSWSSSTSLSTSLSPGLSYWSPCYQVCTYTYISSDATYVNLRMYVYAAYFEFEYDAGMRLLPPHIELVDLRDIYRDFLDDDGEEDPLSAI
jgi:hypothetical protein